MDLIFYLCSLGMQLLVMTIDLITVLLVIRLLCRRWPRQALVALNHSAAPLIDGCLNVAARCWQNLGGQSRPGELQKLLLALLGLAIVRLAVIVVYSLLKQVHTG